MCRLLRDDVTEQLALGIPALTGHAQDWRRLLFPQATDEEFADGFAQAVAFGLGRLVKLEGQQTNLLDRVCTGKTIPATTLREATAAEDRAPVKRKAAQRHSERQGDMRS